MKATITALALTASLTANAGFVSGNQLHDMLSGDEQKIAASVGYIAGVFDMTDHCAPKSVTLTQVVDMTRDMLNASPQIRNYDANILIGALLVKNWPCKKI